jgi:uncharacterized protein YggE
MRIRNGLIALLLCASPVCPVYAGNADEVTMHIVAVGTAMPDTIILPISIGTNGKTAAEAQAVNLATSARLRASILATGVDAKDITVTAKPSADTSDIAIADPSTSDTSNVQGASSTSSMQVIFGDIRKVSPIQTIIDGEKSASAGALVFLTRNIDKARADAIDDGVKRARGDAARYADTLGYRIVRITHISNQKPTLNLPDAITFFQSMEGRRGELKDMVPTFASVEIDYVVAPK